MLTFRKSVLDGPSVEYHENGKEKMKGVYKNGDKKGVWLTMDETGKVISKEKF
jgi:antitoxin component YwqK of YwqJK toxin-antitoxin module